MTTSNTHIILEENLLDGRQVGPIVIEVAESLGILGLDSLVELKKDLLLLDERIRQTIAGTNPGASKVRVVNTVADIRATSNASEGDLFVTLGYASAGDNGHGMYNVESGTGDDVLDHSMSGTLVAKLMADTIARTAQVGCSNATTDTDNLQALLDATGRGKRFTEVALSSDLQISKSIKTNTGTRINLSGYTLRATGTLADYTGNYVILHNTDDGTTLRTGSTFDANSKLGFAIENGNITSEVAAANAGNVKIVSSYDTASFKDLLCTNVATLFWSIPNLDIETYVFENIRLARDYSTWEDKDLWFIQLNDEGSARTFKNLTTVSDEIQDGVYRTPNMVKVTGLVRQLHTYRFDNCVNGNYHLRRVGNTVFDSCAFSGGMVELKDTNARLVSCTFDNSDRTPLMLQSPSDDSGTPKVILEDTSFIVSRAPWVAPLEVQASQKINLLLRDTYRLVMLGDTPRILGISVGYLTVTGNMIPGYQYAAPFASKLGDIQFGRLVPRKEVMQVGAPFDFASVEAKQMDSVVQDSSFTGTYFYRVQYMTSCTHNQGVDLGEHSATVAGTHDTVTLDINQPLRSSDTHTSPSAMVRVYRGTSANSYDKYAEIPAVFLSGFEDTGSQISSIPWIDRAAGAATALTTPDFGIFDKTITTDNLLSAQAEGSQITFTYDTVADMKANAGDIKEGQLVKTRGYYDSTDGNGAEYLITSNVTADNFGIIPIDGTSKFAKISNGDIIHSGHYGVLGGASSDNAAFQALLNAVGAGKRYKIISLTTDVNLTGSVTANLDTVILGNGHTIKATGTTHTAFTSKRLIYVNTTNGTTKILDEGDTTSPRFTIKDTNFNCELPAGQRENLIMVAPYCSTHIENVTCTNVVSLIKTIPNATIHYVTIADIRLTREATWTNNGIYFIELHGQGKSRSISNVNMPEVTTGLAADLIQGIRVTSPNTRIEGMVRLNNIHNGDVRIEDCDSVELSSSTFFGGKVSVYSSNVSMDNVIFDNTRDFAIELEGSESTGYTDLKLNNVTFKEGTYVGKWEHTTAEIEVTKYGMLSMSHSYRAIAHTNGHTQKTLPRLLSSGGAVIPQYDQAAPYLLDGQKIVAGVPDIARTIVKVNSIIGNIVSGSAQDLGDTFTKAPEMAEGVFYYKFDFLYDVVNSTGRSISSELAVTTTASTDVVTFSSIAPNADANGGDIATRTGFVKVYRGTATGSYDKVAIVPVKYLRTLVDTGYSIGGITWSSRTAGAADAVTTPESGLYEYTPWQGNGLILKAETESILVFNNVAEMKAYPSPIRNTYAMTKGYYEPNDGGGMTYEIFTGSETVDNFVTHNLQKSRMARPVLLGEIYARQGGVKGDGTTDDTAAASAVMNYANRKRLIFKWGPGVFRIGPITVNDCHAFKMIGNGSKIPTEIRPLAPSSESLFKFRPTDYTGNGFAGGTFADMTIVAPLYTGSIFDLTSINDNVRFQQIFINGFAGTAMMLWKRSPDLTQAYYFVERVTFDQCTFYGDNKEDIVTTAPIIYTPQGGNEIALRDCTFALQRQIQTTGQTDDISSAEALGRYNSRPALRGTAHDYNPAALGAQGWLIEGCHFTATMNTRIIDFPNCSSMRFVNNMFERVGEYVDPNNPISTDDSCLIYMASNGGSSSAHPCVIENTRLEYPYKFRKTHVIKSARTMIKEPNISPEWVDFSSTSNCVLETSWDKPMEAEIGDVYEPLRNTVVSRVGGSTVHSGRMFISNRRDTGSRDEAAIPPSLGFIKVPYTDPQDVVHNPGRAFLSLENSSTDATGILQVTTVDKEGSNHIPAGKVAVQFRAGKLRLGRQTGGMPTMSDPANDAYDGSFIWDYDNDRLRFRKRTGFQDISMRDLTRQKEVDLFDTVTEMKTGENFTDDTWIFTKGYASVGDGGHATYVVKAASGAEDGFSKIDLTGGKQAVLVMGEAVNPMQAGAVGNGSTDDTAKFDKLFAATPANVIIDGLGKTYKLDYSANITNFPKSGATLRNIVLDQVTELIIPTGRALKLYDVIIKGRGIHFLGGSRFTYRNLRIEDCQRTAIKLTGTNRVIGNGLDIENVGTDSSLNPETHGHAIHIENGFSNSNDVFMTNTRIDKVGGKAAVRIQSSRNVKMYNLDIDYPLYSGIYASGIMADSGGPLNNSFHGVKIMHCGTNRTDSSAEDSVAIISLARLSANSTSFNDMYVDGCFISNVAECGVYGHGTFKNVHVSKIGENPALASNKRVGFKLLSNGKVLNSSIEHGRSNGLDIDPTATNVYVDSLYIRNVDGYGVSRTYASTTDTTLENVILKNIEVSEATLGDLSFRDTGSGKTTFAASSYFSGFVGSGTLFTSGYGSGRSAVGLSLDTNVALTFKDNPANHLHTVSGAPSTGSWYVGETAVNVLDGFQSGKGKVWLCVRSGTYTATPRTSSTVTYTSGSNELTTTSNSFQVGDVINIAGAASSGDNITALRWTVISRTSTKVKLDYPVIGAGTTTTATTVAPEMIEQGSIIKTYDTVAQMVASPVFITGEVLKTKGYHSAGDGGGAEYVVTTGTASPGIDHQLADGRIFKMISSTVLDTRQAGIKHDSTDETLTLQQALNVCGLGQRFKTLRFADNTQINGTVYVKQDTILDLNSTELTLAGNIADYLDTTALWLNSTDGTLSGANAQGSSLSGAMQIINGSVRGALTFTDASTVSELTLASTYGKTTLSNIKARNVSCLLHVPADSLPNKVLVEECSFWVDRTVHTAQSARYPINYVGKGERLIVEGCSFMGSTTDGSPSTRGAIRVGTTDTSSCKNVEIRNCNHGLIEFSNVISASVSSCYFEGGQVAIRDSGVRIYDTVFSHPRQDASVLVHPRKYATGTTFVKLNGVTFVHGRVLPWTDNERDIEVSTASTTVSMKNVTRLMYLYPSGPRVPPMVYVTETAAAPEYWNRHSMYLSLDGDVIDGTVPYTAQAIPARTYATTVTASVGTSSAIPKTLTDGTYHYRFDIIVSRNTDATTVDMSGDFHTHNPSDAAEISTSTATVSGTQNLISLNPSTRGSSTITSKTKFELVRVLRGTSAGNYDRIAYVPLLIDSALVDTGNAINGRPWVEGSIDPSTSTGVATGVYRVITGTHNTGANPPTLY